MSIPTYRTERNNVVTLLDSLKGKGVFSVTGPRRTLGKAIVDGKTVIIPAGSIRTQSLQHPARDKTGHITPSKTFKPQGGRLKFDPASKGLYGPLRPMYNTAEKEQPHDLGKLPGRMGDDRRLSFVDVRTVQEITCNCNDKGENVSSRWVIID